ncbi:MAG: chemotaxis protein CheA [Solirubrobacteraceae bacterium]
MSELLDQFLEEGGELLDDAVNGLLEVERRPDDPELLNAVFRAAHTFKGASGLFDFAPLTHVVHAAEDVLDAVRHGQLSPDGAVVDAAMGAFDLARVWLEAIARDGGLPNGAAAEAQRGAATLRQLLGTPDVKVASLATAAGPQATPVWAADALRELGPRVALELLGDRETVVALRYTPAGEAFFRGDDPLAVVRSLGATVALQIGRDGPWPPIADLDEYDCAVQLTAIAAASMQEAQDSFCYVLDEVELVEVRSADVRATVRQAAFPDAARAVLRAQVQLLGAPCPEEQREARLASVARSVRGALESTGRATELLAPGESDALDGADGPALELLLARLLGDASTTAPNGDQAAVATDEAVHAPVSRTVKVNQAKIDHLLELVGELVVAKNGLPFIARAADDGAENRVLARSIKDHHQVTSRIVEELQAAAMEMRMLPVGVVFGRFPRMVRDLSHRLGKQVLLVCEGEDTVADKDVLELLGDPLVHLVRNSLDHGLETPAQRAAAGKPAEGRLTLRATQESGGVLVEVADDGHGIDPDAVRRAARARGMSTDGLSDQAARELVLAPGFSTADEVSDLSGRGVGMDAVRAVIDKLGGSIGLESETGRGTTVSLRLPLSMAVTRVMVVVAAGQRLGIAVEQIRETLRLSPQDVGNIGRQAALHHRGRVIPLLDLADAVGLDGVCGEDDDLRVLVVAPDGDELGLIVERFEDQLDLMCKPPEGVVAGTPGLAGTALLGDGEVLLVLNLKELLRRLPEREEGLAHVDSV